MSRVVPAVVLGMMVFGAAPTATSAGEIEPVAGVPAASGWKAVIVVEGLEHPWGLAWLPDGSMLITERPGRLRVVRDGVLLKEPIAGVPKVFAGGQGGLMDVSLHPDFAENKTVYLTFSAGTGAANRTSLARGTLEGGRLTNVETIFENARAKQGGQHFGSRIAWLADKTMLVAIGDGGNPPASLDGEHIRKQAQNAGAHFGKVLHLRDDGKPAGDAAFKAVPGALPEVYTMGHRNIQGLVVDPQSGAVWATEHGARGGDELNLIKPGQNYGWPLVTYSVEYWGPKISDLRTADGFVDPVAVWTPCIAPSGLAVYRGDKFPQWRGDLFCGGLMSQDVRRVRVDASGKMVDQDSIAIGQRVRDVRQGPDGFLYVLTDEDNGRLVRIEPAARR